MSMQIRFPGGVSVQASFDGFEVLTDQPQQNGGQNAAPSPFDFFLVSLGTCAGFYALRFCQQRALPTDGMHLTLDTVRHPETRRLQEIDMTLNLTSDFPEKYHRAILRATDQCSVKKVLADPPEVRLHIA